MNAITPELLRELVAEARLAPSVHNIQPARWRLLTDNRLLLIDDTTARVPHADPTGHDAHLSLGAALEGMALALARRGLAIAGITASEQRLSQQHVALCTLAVDATGAPDPLSDIVLRRLSWRGMFRTAGDDDAGFDAIAAARDDVVCIRDAAAIAEIAAWGDDADLFFLRRANYRHELLQWMRLSASHPRYQYDGLNREALAMTAAEGIGAKLVLGRLFAPLDGLGLAPPLISDRGKTASAAGLVLFYRPRGEEALVTGRQFYRAWLDIARAGFSACPISALADHPEINSRLCKLARLPADTHRLVNVFRVGRPARPKPVRHFRWPVDRLIV
jgi:nitroreductase